MSVGGIVVPSETAITIWLCLFFVAITAILLPISRDVHRCGIASREARSSGVLPIAFTRRGPFVLIAAEPPTGDFTDSSAPPLNGESAGARLVICRDGLIEPVASARVWEMAWERELSWFPNKGTLSVGYRRFARIVRADPATHAEAAAGLDEYDAGGYRRAVALLPFALVALSLVVWAYARGVLTVIP